MGYKNLSWHEKRIQEDKNSKVTYTVRMLWEEEESREDLRVDGKNSLTSDIRNGSRGAYIFWNKAKKKNEDRMIRSKG
jgi:hypothetical protein